MAKKKKFIVGKIALLNELKTQIKKLEDKQKTYKEELKTICKSQGKKEGNAVVLNLPDDEDPLYIMPVGRERGD